MFFILRSPQLLPPFFGRRQQRFKLTLRDIPAIGFFEIRVHITFGDEVLEADAPGTDAERPELLSQPDFGDLLARL